jgi:hypothetical protein
MVFKLNPVTDATLTPNQDYYWTGGPGRSSGITTFSWQSGDPQFKPRRAQLYLTTCTTHLHNWRLPTWLNTQLLQVMILRSFSTTQPSLLPFHLQHLRHQALPPSSSPFLLSRRSPLSDLPIRAVDPSLRKGEACDGCKLNSKPRLLLNWWSRTV